METNNKVIVNYILWFNKFSLEQRRRGKFTLESKRAGILEEKDILLGIARREPDLNKVVYGIYSALPYEGDLRIESLVEFSSSEVAAVLSAGTSNIENFEEYDREYEAGIIGTNTNYQLTLGNRRVQYGETLEIFVEGLWVAGRAERDRKGKWTFVASGGTINDFKVGTKARRKL